MRLLILRNAPSECKVCDVARPEEQTYGEEVLRLELAATCRVVPPSAVDEPRVSRVGSPQGFHFELPSLRATGDLEVVVRIDAEMSSSVLRHSSHKVASLLQLCCKGCLNKCA